MIVIMSPEMAALFDDGSTAALGGGEALFHAGEPVRSMFHVVAGQILLVRNTESGSQVILQRALGGHVLAEASAYSDSYHCGAMAAEASEVRSVPVARFRRRLEADPELGALWAAHLAHAVQRSRLQSEIRTLRTVASRLDTWLAEYGPLPARGQWQDLAAELGVSREALYRELATRRAGRAY